MGFFLFRVNRLSQGHCHISETKLWFARVNIAVRLARQLHLTRSKYKVIIYMRDIQKFRDGNNEQNDFLGVERAKWENRTESWRSKVVHMIR